MVQLPNHTPDGELCSYVRNFERWVLTEGLDQWKDDRVPLDDRYDGMIAAWGGRWECDGFVFDDDRDATAFLLRWA